MLRPVVERLDALARSLETLTTSNAALTETLATRDAHWEQRLGERTSQLEARLDALVAEVERLTPEVRALRAAQAEGVAYLGRRLEPGAPAQTAPPVDA